MEVAEVKSKVSWLILLKGVCNFCLLLLFLLILGGGRFTLSSNDGEVDADTDSSGCDDSDSNPDPEIVVTIVSLGGSSTGHERLHGWLGHDSAEAVLA